MASALCTEGSALNQRRRKPLTTETPTANESQQHALMQTVPLCPSADSTCHAAAGGAEERARTSSSQSAACTGRRALLRTHPRGQRASSLCRGSIRVDQCQAPRPGRSFSMSNLRAVQRHYGIEAAARTDPDLPLPLPQPPALAMLVPAPDSAERAAREAIRRAHCTLTRSVEPQ